MRKEELRQEDLNFANYFAELEKRKQAGEAHQKPLSKKQIKKAALAEKRKSESPGKKAARLTLEMGIYLISAVFSISEGAHALKAYSEKPKSNDMISQDAIYFDANMDVANLYGQNIVMPSDYKRFAHNGDKPIYVSIDDEFPASDVELIHQTLNYYEELFADINPNYRFEVVSELDAYVRQYTGSAVIRFDYGHIKYDGVLGYNKSRMNFMYWDFLRFAHIKLSEDAPSAPKERYYILIHEMAHTFGLGDVYSYLTDNVYQDTFLKHTETAEEMGMLYPNDVAMLHAMYGEKYRDGDKIIKQELEKSVKACQAYQDMFYDKLSEYVIEDVCNQTYFRQMSSQDFGSFTYSFNAHTQNTSGLYGGQYSTYEYEITQIDDKMARFVIKDEGNKIVTDIKTQYIIRSGVVLLPKVHLKKGPYPNEKQESTPESFKMFAMYKEGASVKVVDLYRTFGRTVNKETKQESQNENTSTSFNSELDKKIIQTEKAVYDTKYSIKEPEVLAENVLAKPKQKDYSM